MTMRHPADTPDAHLMLALGVDMGTSKVAVIDRQGSQVHVAAAAHEAALVAWDLIP